MPSHLLYHHATARAVDHGQPSISCLQIGSRAERMGLAPDDIYIYSATRLQDVLAEMLHMRPRAVIIDSIQTVYLDDVNGSAGSVSQVLHH